MAAMSDGALPPWAAPQPWQAAAAARTGRAVRRADEATWTRPRPLASGSSSRASSLAVLGVRTVPVAHGRHAAQLRVVLDTGRPGRCTSTRASTAIYENVAMSGFTSTISAESVAGRLGHGFAHPDPRPRIRERRTRDRRVRRYVAVVDFDVQRSRATTRSRVDSLRASRKCVVGAVARPSRSRTNSAGWPLSRRRSASCSSSAACCSSSASRGAANAKALAAQSPWPPAPYQSY